MSKSGEPFDPFLILEEPPHLPFKEEIVRKRKRGAGVSGAGIPVVLIGAGLHYLAGRAMKARTFKIFRNHS